MSNVLERMKSRYGFSKTSLKWIGSEGASILENVGMEVVAVEFTKNENGDWSNVIKAAVIQEISEFDPMTITYLCKYKIVGEEGDEIKEVRIIPEGYSLIGDDSNWMIRFVPYSQHCKLSETEAFYNRLFKIQAKAKTISLTSLETLSSSKEMEQTLGYSMNIGAVIKTEDNEILWFRVKKLNVHHKFKDNYNLSLTSWDDKNFVIPIKSSDEEYDFSVNKTFIGKMKLVDLQCYT